MVVEFAAANGVREPRLSDVAVAVSEAMTNAVVHAFRGVGDEGTIVVAVAVGTLSVLSATAAVDFAWCRLAGGIPIPADGFTIPDAYAALLDAPEGLGSPEKSEHVAGNPGDM